MMPPSSAVAKALADERLWRSSEARSKRFRRASRRRFAVQDGFWYIHGVLSNREDFIDEHRALFWYTPEEAKRDISDELLVETILNYAR